MTYFANTLFLFSDGPHSDIKRELFYRAVGGEERPDQDFNTSFLQSAYTERAATTPTFQVLGPWSVNFICYNVVPPLLF